MTSAKCFYQSIPPLLPCAGGYSHNFTTIFCILCTYHLYTKPNVDIIFECPSSSLTVEGGGRERGRRVSSLSFLPRDLSSSHVSPSPAKKHFHRNVWSRFCENVSRGSKISFTTLRIEYKSFFHNEKVSLYLIINVATWAVAIGRTWPSPSLKH